MQGKPTPHMCSYHGYTYITIAQCIVLREPYYLDGHLPDRAVQHHGLRCWCVSPLEGLPRLLDMGAGNEPIHAIESRCRHGDIQRDSGTHALRYLAVDTHLALLASSCVARSLAETFALTLATVCVSPLHCHPHDSDYICRRYISLLHARGEWEVSR